MEKIEEQQKLERIKDIVDAMHGIFEDFVTKIYMECTPAGEDHLAHRIAHLKGHFNKDCIHYEETKK